MDLATAELFACVLIAFLWFVLISRGNSDSSQNTQFEHTGSAGEEAAE